MPLQQPLPIAKVDLDWKAYYEAFKVAHGSDPVAFRERLLFSDGWTYSAEDYRGPEWPPPEDEAHLRIYQRSYWALRRLVVVKELASILATKRGLEELQRTRSAPLQHRVVTESEGTDGKRKRETEVHSLDVPRLWVDRIRWLEEDLRICNKSLLFLKESYASQVSA